MSKSNKQSFLHGAAILVVAVVVVKIIGALYKIPLGNILGKEGMGYFGTAYSIYNMLLTISTAGLPVALSKMVSEASTQGRRAQVNKIFSITMVTFVVVGLVGSGIMLVFSEPLAAAMGNDPARKAILALGPSVLFVCIMASFRGYFQGLSNMKPTAMSQVIEALSKLVIGLTLAWWLVKAGYGLETAAAGSIIGVTVGTVLGAAYLLIKKIGQRRIESEAGPALDTPGTGKEILGKLLRLAIPISIGASAMSIISFIDTMLILNRLQDAAGFIHDEANAMYGAYFNTQTLFNLPAAFITPLAISVIPAVASAVTRGDQSGAGRTVGSSLRIAAILALPAGVGLSVLSGPILELLYTPELSEPGTPILSVLGFASIFVCFVLLTNAILQAYGRVKTPVYTMIIGGIIKIVVNWVLVGTPSINIMGAPIGTTLCYITILVLNIIAIIKVVPTPPNFIRIFAKPVIAAAVMGVVAYEVYGTACGVMGASLATLAAIVVALLIYLILVIVLRIVSREDMLLLPKGEKIANILRLK